MDNLERLRKAISSVLSTEKAYDVQERCVQVGLTPPDGGDAWSGKERYVYSLVRNLCNDALIETAEKVKKWRSSYELEEALELSRPSRDGVISAICRRDIVDELDQIDNLPGRLGVVQFASRIFPLTELRPPTFDFKSLNLQDYVIQHMVNNPEDLSWKSFMEEVNYLDISEDRFRRFLEECVHPEVRSGESQRAVADVLNRPLQREGFELRPVDEMSGYPVFRLVKTGGVEGRSKNLIFAAIGPKPEIVLADAINNDLRVVRNEEFCLVYDRPIGIDGLAWTEMVDWWLGLHPDSKDAERDLYKRLYQSLDSEAERNFFKSYFEHLRPKSQGNLPALIPQVYLHYDPYTLRELPNGSALRRQRMDFLLLLPGRRRIVMEIDGQQHYSEDGRPSPRLYAQMVSEDRTLRLQGYELYRFGGLELTDADFRTVVISFLDKLFRGK